MYMLWLSAWHFSGTPNCGSRCVSDSFFLLLGLFLLLGCLVQLLCEGLCFCIIVFYFVVLGYCLLETCFFFLKGDGWGVDPEESGGGRELKEGEEREL